MEKLPKHIGKGKKTKQNKTITEKSSGYGSVKTGPSSSSSLSVSLFSEGSYLDPHSTSGCSSEMATTSLQLKQKKKEKAKEFMRKLKSMLPKKEQTGKLDTLSTLEQLVHSMRQINEDQKQDSEFKVPPPHNGSYVTSDVEKFHQSDMYITVSLKNHVVITTSNSLMEHLGYPVDWWRGRVLKDFIHKQDINTVNGCISMHSSEDHPEMSDTVTVAQGGQSKESAKYFYGRIRRFRKLGAGFNIQNIVSFCPFMMMISRKEVSDRDSESGNQKKGLIVHLSPLQSAYEEGKPLPEERTFGLRHSLHCNYSYVHPNAVRLLGFLPQDFNGMSIFDIYHPDDFEKLLETHKKIMQSMGQPFKSGPMHLKTRNGCYVEVETEWSSFMNPWSMRLEFIIGQHKVLRGPERPNLFEDIQLRPEKAELTDSMKKIKAQILEVLKKPVQGVFTEPEPVIPNPVKAPTTPSPTSTKVQTPNWEIKGAGEKAKGGESSTTTESKTTVIDDKGISSIYNQLNYSHNIKRFLMSHPKSFSNVSDEDSMMTRDDSEDDAINDEEVMPLTIPVAKPPSCGSSTQVHVSEQGHGEEMLSAPTFGDEAMPQQEPPKDSYICLTEETLKKHTKIQERLYLQRISEEQPLLLNMRRIKSAKNTSNQKRPRQQEPGENLELSAKQQCIKSGVFRSSSNIFMKSFPTMNAPILAPPTATTPMFGQAEVINQANFDNSFIGIRQSLKNLGFQGFPTGHQPTGFPYPAQPIQLLTHDSSVCLPQNLTSVMPNTAIGDTMRPSTDQNIQWPYYPQAGYTLMPQVMAGFYQPVQMPPITPEANNSFVKSVTATQTMKEPEQGEQPAKKSKMDPPKKSDVYNLSSSLDDTASSIMYLLDSSTYEDSDNKNTPVVQSQRQPKKRSLEPSWVRDVKWNSDLKMRYQVPQRKLNNVLKMDDKFAKKAAHGELVMTSLQQMLEDVSGPEHDTLFDEEADYMFYPGDSFVDEDISTHKEMIVTGMDTVEDRGEGGSGEPDAAFAIEGEEGMWSDSDTPANSGHSHTGDSEKSTPATPTPKEDISAKDTKEDMLKTSDKDANNESLMSEMETVYMERDQQTSDETQHKRGSSPKESLSGDEGSDGGNKPEDSQSNSSKVSSDLTPSDNRSNEEAGSSLKESDRSATHIKENSSVASSNSDSTPQMCAEASEDSAVADIEEIFKKLFVPLKVRVQDKLNSAKEPYWLVEAQLTKRIAMTYTVPSPKLEEVLVEDRKKMASLVQSATVKQQLLQLLSEVDVKAKSSPLSLATKKGCSLMSISVTEPSKSTSTQRSDCSDKVMKQSICDSPVSLSKKVSIPQSATVAGAQSQKESKQEVMKDCDQGSSSEPSSAVAMSEEVSDQGVDLGCAIDSTTSSLNKETSFLSLHPSFEKSDYSPLPVSKSQQSPFSKSKDVTNLAKEETGYTSSSDTNTDPVAHDSFPQSSTINTPSSSNEASAKEQSNADQNPSWSDAYLKEYLQTMQSSNISEQNLEDIIMSNIFEDPTN